MAVAVIRLVDLVQTNQKVLRDVLDLISWRFSNIATLI